MKKRIGFIGLVTALIFGLTGCGMSAKDEYIKLMEKNESQQVQQSDLTMRVDEIELGDSALSDPMAGVVYEVIENMQIKGNVNQDQKNKLIAVKMDVNLFDMTIPIQGLISEEHLYVSTDSIISFIELASMVSGMNEIEDMQEKLKKISGKYIDVFDLNEDMKKQFDFSKKLVGNNTKIQKESNKESVKFLKGINEKKVTKKNGTYIVNYSKNDMKELGKLGTKILGDNFVSKEVLKDTSINEIYNDLFEEFSMVTYYNPDKMNQKVEITIIPKESNGDIKKMKMSYVVKNEAKAKPVKMPKKELILSEENVTKLLGEKETDKPGEKMTDEQFKQFKEEILPLIETQDSAKKEKLLKELKDSCTEEQYKEIEERLNY